VARPLDAGRRRRDIRSDRTARTIDEMKMLPVSPLTDVSFDFQDLLFVPVPLGK